MPLEGLPVVAFVGRPNVGKSTLFNRVIGQRVAIVEDRARTTRDRLYDVGEWSGRRFIVVDTGGLETHPGDAIEERVQDQARLAISEAEVIVFVVDAEAGLTPADQQASELLRTASAPVIVAANKADNPKRELEAAEFHVLGFAETHPISALHGRGVADLLDVVVWSLPAESAAEIERKRREAEQDEGDFGQDEANAAGNGERGAEAAFAFDDRPARVAIIGRPNVGKSSLLNALIGQERVIVSPVPGTTRDAIDTPLVWGNLPVTLIDTAGIRKRGHIDPGVEKYSVLRALRAIERADVALLVIDGVEGVTAQDAHVAGYILEENKSVVLVVNKWDMLQPGLQPKEDGTLTPKEKEFSTRLRSELNFLDYVPVLFVSAKTGLRVDEVMAMALRVQEERLTRISTSELNRIVRDAVDKQSPPSKAGQRLKIYYGSQVRTDPPTFLFFVNDTKLVHFSYERFLENQIRAVYEFVGTPLRLSFRNRARAELD
jgi:GTPase